MKLNKIGEVWNSANRLLSDIFRLLPSKNVAGFEGKREIVHTIATWRNDFPSLL